MIVTDCLKFLLSAYPLMSSELNKDGIFGFTNCNSKIYSQTAVFVLSFDKPSHNLQSNERNDYSKIIMST